MKCTNPMYCLNRDSLPFDLLPSWVRTFGSSSKEYVKSTDLRTKFRFFLLSLFRFIHANSVLLAV